MSGRCVRLLGFWVLVVLIFIRQAEPAWSANRPPARFRAGVFLLTETLAESVHCVLQLRDHLAPPATFGPVWIIHPSTSCPNGVSMAKINARAVKTIPGIAARERMHTSAANVNAAASQ
jgi:hypothetical protein